MKNLLYNYKIFNVYYGILKNNRINEINLSLLYIIHYVTTKQILNNIAKEKLKFYFNITCKKSNQININYIYNNRSFKFFNLCIYKLLKGYSIQYILKKWYFKGFLIFCKPPVLVPRIETEKIIDICIYELNLRQNLTISNGINILEIGIGSGCICVALLKYIMNVNKNYLKKIKYIRYKGLDIEKTAIELSYKNLDINNISISKQTSNKFFLEFKNISFESYVNEHISNKYLKYDILISNPPYIPLNLKNNSSLNLKFEDKRALYSGEDGLDLIKLIVINSKFLVKIGGFVLLEIFHSHDKLITSFILNNQSLHTSHISSYFFIKDDFNKIRFLLININ